MAEDKPNNKNLLPFEKPLLELYKKIDDLKKVSKAGKMNLDEEIKMMEKRIESTKYEIYSKLTPLEMVLVARHIMRPTTSDYIGMIFEDFIELHGDRLFGDDPALVCGIAKFDGKPCMVIGHQKGKNTKENLARNFGMAQPEGYRKALRLMQMADRFGRPIICFIDTPGAYPGIGAEERGQAEAIARNLREMSEMTVPIIAVITGEGGSGGALGIGIGNRVLMFEYSIYSVISPEGCAAILFRDASRAPQAAESLKITAKDLKGLEVIDDIIKEPIGAAHSNPEQAAKNLKAALIKHLNDLNKMSPRELLADRYRKFRKMGIFSEE